MSVTPAFAIASPTSLTAQKADQLTRTRNGRAIMPYGVMGGDYQPFGHVHVLTNRLDFGMDLQEAIDFAANGLVRAKIERQPLTAINDIFARMKKGQIAGRVVLAIGSR